VGFSYLGAESLYVRVWKLGGMLAHRLNITNPQDYGLYSLKSHTGTGMLIDF